MVPTMVEVMGMILLCVVRRSTICFFSQEMLDLDTVPALSLARVPSRT